MLSCSRMIMHSNTLFRCMSGFMSTRKRSRYSGALNSTSSLKELEAVLHEPLHQGSSNLSLEGQSAAEFSSNPDQTHLPVLF